MRKIPTVKKCSWSAVAKVGRRACLAALLASSLTTASFKNAIAQSPDRGRQSPVPVRMASAPTAIATNYSVLSEPSLIDEGGPVYITENNGGIPVSVMNQGNQMQMGMPNGVVADSVIHQAGPVSGDPLAGTVVEGDGGYFTGYNNCPACTTPGCDVSWYINYEALLLRRDGDDRYTLTTFTRIPRFDYELGRIGGRITTGRLFDCHNGIEAVYVGPYKWQRGLRTTGANIDSNLVASLGYDANDIDAFNNSTIHVQAWEARMNSYEVNRTWWTWDVLQTLFGIRYLDYSEDYSLSTTTPVAGNGFLLEQVRNRGIGPQIGGQFMQPVSLRANYGIRGKAAVMANFVSANTFMTNDNVLLLNNGDDSVKVSGVVEGGVFANYQVVPSVRVTGGYEFWYMPRFATVPEQNLTSITPATGSRVGYKSDVFLHGLSLGVQVLY